MRLVAREPTRATRPGGPHDERRSARGRKRPRDTQRDRIGSSALAPVGARRAAAPCATPGTVDRDLSRIDQRLSGGWPGLAAYPWPHPGQRERSVPPVSVGFRGLGTNSLQIGGHLLGLETRS